jgi:hypothetical protein
MRISLAPATPPFPLSGGIRMPDARGLLHARCIGANRGRPGTFHPSRHALCRRPKAMAHGRLASAAFARRALAENGAQVKGVCANSVALCTELPEIEACSGPGKKSGVVNRSSAGGHRLRLTSTCGLASAAVRSLPNLSVPAAAAMACPALVVEDFLKACRGDVDAQRTFAGSPLVLACPMVETPSGAAVKRICALAMVDGCWRQTAIVDQSI